MVKDGLRLLIPFLNDTMTRYPHIQVFFRNTVAGHPRCDVFNKPLQIEDHYNRKVDYSEYKVYYHWDKFAVQNEFMSTAFESIKALKLDVNSSTYFRPDGHLNPNHDCLHYCAPGPADNWIVLFYNSLLKYNKY